jgi:hypothetical protein
VSGQPGEAGHLFIARSDLTQLACDAVLVPTDPARTVTGAWSRLVAAVPEPTADWPDVPLRATGPDRSPQAWLVATAALAEHGGSASDVATALDLLLTRVEAFVACASDRLADEPVAGRERPLLALPIVGTGAGGLRTRPGAVIRALVDRLGALATAHGVDVVLVAHSAEHEALCRHWRRRVWARDTGDGDAYTDVVADRWCVGHVRDGRVVVGPAAEELRALRDRAERGSLVPFFGSGVSRASGAARLVGAARGALPPAPSSCSTSSARRTRRRCPTPSPGRRSSRTSIPGGGQALQRKLRERLAVEHLSLPHVLLANLGARDAITTNYDLGYERACEAGGIEVSIVPEPGGDRRLVKLHGSLGQQGGPAAADQGPAARLPDRRGALWPGCCRCCCSRAICSSSATA